MFLWSSEGKVMVAERIHVMTSTLDAILIVLWFWDHAGNIAITQRSMLISISTKTLLNMLKNSAEEVSLHNASPKGQFEVIT